jgi:beta-glucosidase
MIVLLITLSSSRPIYLDPTRSVKERVDDLIANMTLEEKVGQLQQIDGHFDIVEPFKTQFPGSVLSILGDDAIQAIQLANESRLQIPILLGVDAIHGHGFVRGATVFPIQLGAAATWDESIIEMQGNVTAFEMRYTGPAWTFSPVLCIARDPRWGRIDETFGEDPFLIGRFATALIRGLQGPNGLSNDPDKVMATAKHYAGYSETEGGRDASEADLSQRKLRSFFFPPFQKAAEAKVGSFMTGYQAIEGVPSTANKWMLTDILRGEWGFDGILVTDYNNVGYLVTNQEIAKDYAEAAGIAVTSGNDMMMGTPGFFQGALDAIAAGAINLTQLEESVRRILEIKVNLGLFEDPRMPDSVKAQERIGSPYSRAQAQKAAEEGLILLKNDGLLPIDSSGIKNIAIVGPNADHPLQQSGDWSLGTGQLYVLEEHPRNCTITVVDAFNELLPGKVVYEKGAWIEPGEEADLSAAVTAVQNSDVAVVVIGDRLMYYGEQRSTGTLELMGNQKDLLNAVIATGKKFVIVVIASKPLIIDSKLRERANAIIWQFCPGMLGGRATAKAIFGLISPSGRLPITIPEAVGQIPVYYQKIRGQHGSTYADCTESPAYSFGYGLTYGKFDYLSVTLDKTTYQATDDILVTVTIRNDGARDAVEVVQCYVSDLITSATWTDQELKGYARQEVAAGTQVDVKIIIKAAELSIVTSDSRRVVEPGDFELRVGAAANDIRLKQNFAIQ